MDQFIEKSIDFLPKQQLVYSPFSLYLLFSILALGSENISSQNLNSNLNESSRFQIDHKSNEKLFDQINKLSKDGTFFVNNALFYDKELTLKTFFSDVISKYKTLVKPTSFSNVKQVVTLINQHIEKQTQGHIKNMLDENSMSNLITSVLVNTVYLNFQWKTIFMPNSTSKIDFFVNFKKKIKVSCMSFGNKIVSLEHCIYDMNDKHVESIILPLKNELFTFEFIKPYDYSESAFYDSEKIALLSTSQQYEQQNLQEQQIQQEQQEQQNLQEQHSRNKKTMRYFKKVIIPKVNTNTRIFANELASLLNIPKNLSEMFQEKNDNYLDQIIHESQIKIDERGVLATSASVAITRGASLSKNEGKGYEFILDGPFIGVLRYENTILYHMRILDPRK